MTSMIGREMTKAPGGICHDYGSEAKLDMLTKQRLNVFAHLLLPLIAIGLNACGSGNQAQPGRSENTSPAAATPKPVQPPDSNPVPDTRPVIVAFGDSLTAGYGVEPGKSYPDDLQRLIDSRGYRYHVVNMGVSGDTTTDGVQRLPDVLAAKPSIVILEFGGNDGLRGLPVATTKANLNQMVDTLQKAGVRVLLAGMSLPRNYGPDYIHSFEQVYIDVATRFHVARIPFLLDGVGGHPDLMQADGIHPTADGAKIVSNNVMNHLTSLLKK
jgi:acyl-CoA thioesterase-1